MQLRIGRLLALGLLFSSCGGSDHAATYMRQVGELCDNINNCDVQYHCIGGICRTICLNDNDCISKKQHCSSGNFCADNPGNSCREGWSGGNCDTCADDFYGKNCQKCPDCGNHGECNDTMDGDGSCQCASGWTGPYCNECTDRRFGGPNCDRCADNRFTGTKCDECIDGAIGTIQDQAGKNYKTICFNKQFWMAENMNYASGTNYHVNGAPQNDAAYGLLYDWHTAGTICPSGSYLPDIEEFQDLASYLNGKNRAFTIAGSAACKDGDFCLPAGGIYFYISDNYSDFDQAAYLWSANEAECPGSDNKCGQLYKITQDKTDIVTDDLHSAQPNGASVICVQKICEDRRFFGKNCDQCDYSQNYGPACTPYGTVTDIDNNSYKTIVIDGTTWMAENLKTTKDRNNNAIDCLANTAEDNDFIKNYGCLYSLADLEKKTMGPGNICPAGWRLPTKSDFENMLTYLGKDSIASIKLRQASFNYGNNLSGFSALPAGLYYDGNFSSFGASTYFWSSTENEDNSSEAYLLNVYPSSASISRIIKSYGLSIRCVRASK